MEDADVVVVLETVDDDEEDDELEYLSKEAGDRLLLVVQEAPQAFRTAKTALLLPLLLQGAKDCTDATSRNPLSTRTTNRLLLLVLL
jgi:hypothetical protein